MKRILTDILILTLVSTLTSCSFIGDVFKAGMGFGIFLVVALILGLVFLLMRIGKK